MPIELVLDSLDSVEESDKQFFDKTEDEKFKFNVARRDEFVKKPLDTKNKQLKTEKDKLNEKYRRYDALKDASDEELQGYLEWKERQASGEGDPAHKNGDGKGSDLATERAKWTKERADEKAKLEKKHADELKARDDKYADSERKRLAFVKEMKLDKLGIDGKVLGDRFHAYRSLAERAYGLDENENLVPLDEDGEPMPEKAEDFLKGKFYERNRFLFEAADGKGGSGAENNGRGGNNGKKTIKRSVFDALSEAQKSQKIKDGFIPIDG